MRPRVWVDLRLQLEGKRGAWQSRWALVPRAALQAPTGPFPPLPELRPRAATEIQSWSQGKIRARA